MPARSLLTALLPSLTRRVRHTRYARRLTRFIPSSFLCLDTICAILFWFLFRTRRISSSSVFAVILRSWVAGGRGRGGDYRCLDYIYNMQVKVGVNVPKRINKAVK